MNRPDDSAPAAAVAAAPARAPLHPAVGLAAVLAATLPSLLAYNVSPSPTFLNQALALGLWGSFVLFLALGQPAAGRWRAAADSWTVQAALALLAGAALWSCTRGALPWSLGLSSLGQIAAAALLVYGGAAAARDGQAVEAFVAFAWGWLVAGLFNLAIGLVQVFAPSWPDGDWIAVSNIVGRAVGNLRQPNHLSSLLLWSAICTVALIELRRLRRDIGALVFVGLVFGVVLTASRTGLVSVIILALWGLVDALLSRWQRGCLGRSTRLLLLAAPLVYAAGWSAMVWWADISQHTFGGAARLAESDVSGSRFGVWANTLALIRANPLTGVGWGEFNFAWSLSAFPGRPVAFFDHTHNLPLQLAVELGLPLAALVLALLLAGLGVMGWQSLSARGDLAVARSTATLFVLMIGLHSLLEYPLWYAYFLMPTAWAFGFGLGRLPAAGSGPARAGVPLLAAAAVLLTAGAAYSVWDYHRVTVIFSAAEGAAPLSRRIERGQRSVFFSHHADYAAATTEVEPRLREQAFDRAAHFLLDTRLVMAWAEELAARGDTERARYLVDRLREFRNAASREFLSECHGKDGADKETPFQCAPPATRHDWRDFIPKRR